MTYLNAFLIAIGIVLVIFLITPWVAYCLEDYWDWCRNKQAEMRKQRESPKED